MTKNRTPTPVYLDPGMHPGLEVKGLRNSNRLMFFMSTIEISGITDLVMWLEINYMYKPTDFYEFFTKVYLVFCRTLASVAVLQVASQIGKHVTIHSLFPNLSQ